MTISVLNNKFEKIAIIDIYQSLMWCIRYNNIGALDLEIDATVENLQIFKKGFFISRDDDKHIFRIEAIEINTNDDNHNVLLIGALDIMSILNQRVVTKHFSSTQKLSDFVKTLINNEFSNDRSLDFPIQVEVENDPVLFRETTEDYAGDLLMNICQNEELKCDFYFENGSYKIVISTIEDRTANQNKNIRIVFSNNNDNLISSKYNVDTTNYKNVAFVYTEDKTNGVFSGIAKGIERRELIIKSSKKESDNTSLEYEGQQKLIETLITTSFENEVDSLFYKYKTDYNVGDIVTIQNDFGISANVRVTEVIETWDQENYTLEPKFDYYEEVFNYENVLLTEELEGLLTENVELLMIENSPIVLEDETQYIITEDGKLIDSE